MSLEVSLVERIDAETERRSLLKHPFYQMWAKGELTLDHLAGYSREYFRLVDAVPELVEQVRQRAETEEVEQIISESLSEEREHIDLWIRFAASLGVSSEELLSYEQSEKTKEAISELK